MSNVLSVCTSVCLYICISPLRGGLSLHKSKSSPICQNTGTFFFAIVCLYQLTCSTHAERKLCAIRGYYEQITCRSMLLEIKWILLRVTPLCHAAVPTAVLWNNTKKKKKSWVDENTVFRIHFLRKFLTKTRSCPETIKFALTHETILMLYLSNVSVFVHMCGRVFLPPLVTRDWLRSVIMALPWLSNPYLRPLKLHSVNIKSEMRSFKSTFIRKKVGHTT